jgi:hypothetical protein
MAHFVHQIGIVPGETNWSTEHNAKSFAVVFFHVKTFLVLVLKFKMAEDADYEVEEIVDRG